MFWMKPLLDSDSDSEYFIYIQGEIVSLQLLLVSIEVRKKNKASFWQAGLKPQGSNTLILFCVLYYAASIYSTHVVS